MSHDIIDNRTRELVPEIVGGAGVGDAGRSA